MLKSTLSSVLIAAVSIGLITACGLGKSGSPKKDSELNSQARGLPNSGEVWSRPGLGNSSLGIVIAGQPAQALFDWLTSNGGQVEAQEWGKLVSNAQFKCTYNPTRDTQYECAFSVIKDGSVVQGL